jgi:hypothetical protein
MFKWKRKHEGNKFEYTLVLDDGSDNGSANDNDNDEVIGSVTVIEDINGDIIVAAEYEEIGYKATQGVEKKFLEIMVSNMKKFIKDELEEIEVAR